MVQMLIGGEAVGSVAGNTYEVHNPATGEVVGTAPKGTSSDVDQAVDAARGAFGAWADTSAEDRGLVLLDACARIRANAAEIAQLLTAEQGKTLFEANLEIHHLLHGLEFYAGLASKVRGSHVPLPQKGAYGMVIRQPIGVCGAIIPWNFPLTLMGTKLGPALAAGNTIVIKPASTTPLATLKTVELIQQATYAGGKKQLPPGTVNVVTGSGSDVGERLLVHPDVRRIAFTGSTEVGRHVMEVAGREIKRITLELGGSDPMIVCEDADVDAAAKNADVGRFFNCGQMCLGVKRLFVHDSVYDAFVTQLRGILEKKTVGPGTEKTTRMGPLHLASQRDEIESQVQDARTRGAQIVCGGARPQGDAFASGNYFQPTLIENAPLDSRVVTEEVFGPVLPVFRFTDLNQAIEMANDSMYGLGGSIWTRNLVWANRAIDRLQAGNVWVNSLHYGYDELPFGGVKASGLGREHGPEALDYYLETKGVVIAGLS
ncbi:MAG TPA: aldehyde dehydrogenase family protein [Chloroflexota bacterium]|jgi:succinate-semialdehyde dehydrogenase/glutarate-semialdehyde dehydrogenase|nr:aldehyde dehydrogenase family protein [Chloroflexota bacterium]